MMSGHRRWSTGEGTWSDETVVVTHHTFSTTSGGGAREPVPSLCAPMLEDERSFPCREDQSSIQAWDRYVDRTVSSHRWSMLWGKQVLP